VFVAPGDLDEMRVLDAVRAGWMPRAEAVAYLPVGFGSHHWRVDGLGDSSLFVTVDDLDKQRRDRADSRDSAFARLRGAFGAASALRRDAGLGFVAAPLVDVCGEVVRRVTDRYSLVVHPLLTGLPAGAETFTDPRVRDAVVDLLVGLHRADLAGHLAPRDDPVLPNGDALMEGLDQLAVSWDSGPYGDRARHLLAAHAHHITGLTAAYASLANKVLGGRDHLVLTHGEPVASNVMLTEAGLFLVDWESARLAPPERDLWSLAEEDPSILDRYSARAGRPVDRQAIGFYRLWYDLFEIGGYLRLFRQAHGDDADTAESWKNLQHFLRPSQRWPELCT
jgi:hypothetical protein